MLTVVEEMKLSDFGSGKMSERRHLPKIEHCSDRSVVLSVIIHSYRKLKATSLFILRSRDASVTAILSKILVCLICFDRYRGAIASDGLRES
jgi:hypothetical protein